MSTHKTPSSQTSKENTTFVDATPSHGRSRSGKGVTQARARAQRAKLDTQAQERAKEEQQPDHVVSGEKQQEGQEEDRKKVTLERAIQDYLDDHEGGNHMPKR